MSYSKPDDASALEEFTTSSRWSKQVPAGYTAWKIRNDYPPPKPVDLAPGGPPPGTPDAPWLDVDYKNHPLQFLEIAKEYCLEGMIAADFVPQNNTIRQWYHAPWMHYGDDGREPLRGMTPEMFAPPLELSETQHRTTQTWAIGFYNAPGASVFGGMWANPAKPDWTENKRFPIGTMVFKLLFTNARDDELPILKGSPAWKGCIAVQPADPQQPPVQTVRDIEHPQSVRVIQMDVAMRIKGPVGGWVWGTFMYSNTSGKTGWDGLLPVGVQWGNDANLTQVKWEKGGERVKESWVNPEADKARSSMHGLRPFFGWNGRLNGPTDNFISACASCHSTAQWPPQVEVHQPPVHKNEAGIYEPKDDSVTMTWFKDVKWGFPFSEGSVTADNSLQLLIGYQNFYKWSGQHIPGKPLPNLPRQGPIIKD